MLKKKKINKNNVSYLPEEPVIQILLKLTVRDLGRFKVVCKSWLSLIESPSFIRQHLEVSKRKNPCILLCQGSAIEKQSISLVSCGTRQVLQTHKVASSIPKTSSSYHSSIVGSCNGIVCLRVQSIKDNTIVLWNPVMKHTKIIPYCCQTEEQERRICHTHGNILLGFGFDSKSNDYKVVLPHTSSRDHLRLFVDSVKIYSLKTNSWRTCLNHYNLVANYQFYSMGCCCYGTYCWMTKRKREDHEIRVLDKDDYEVVAFDMANEVFKSTPFLSNIMGKPLLTHQGSVNGSFAVVSTNNLSCNFGEEFSVWVLGEHGVKESWMKLFSFGSNIGFGSPWAWGENLNNQLVFVKRSRSSRRSRKGGKLVLFDSKSKQVTCFPTLDHNEIISKIHNFSESLVPIN